MVRFLTPLLLCTASAIAAPSEPVLMAAVQNESLSLPSAERLFTRFNPGVEAGFGWTWWRSGRLRLVQHATLGVWVHPGFATSFVTRTTVGLQVGLVAGLALGGGVSVGYLGQRPDAPLFRRTDAGFSTATPWLNRFVGGMTLEVGYTTGRLTPFLAYSVFVEAPFLAKFSPIIPHQVLQLGLRFALETVVTP